MCASCWKGNIYAVKSMQPVIEMTMIYVKLINNVLPKKKKLINNVMNKQLASCYYTQ